MVSTSEGSVGAFHAWGDLVRADFGQRIYQRIIGFGGTSHIYAIRYIAHEKAYALARAAYPAPRLRGSVSVYPAHTERGTTIH